MFKNKGFMNTVTALCFFISFILIYSLSPSSLIRYKTYFCIMQLFTGIILILGLWILKNKDTPYSFIILIGTLTQASFLIYALELSISFIFSSNVIPLIKHTNISPCMMLLLTVFFLLDILLALYCYDKPTTKRTLFQYFVANKLFISALILKFNFFNTEFHINKDCTMLLIENWLKISPSLLCIFILCGIFLFSIIILYKKNYFLLNPHGNTTKIILTLLFILILFVIHTPLNHPILRSFSILTYSCYSFLLLKILIDTCFLSSDSDKNAEVEAYKQTYIDLSKDMENYIITASNLKQQVANIDNIYKHLLQIYPDGFFILSEDVICDTNDTAADMLGAYSPHILINANFFSFVPTKYHQELKKLFTTLQEGNPKIGHREFELIRNDQSTTWVEGSFIIFNSYESSLILISLRDVSYRKQQARLEQEIEMERLKVEFFSSISHELKTPLNIIYSASHLQNELLNLKEYNKLPYYNQMISHNCLRLLRLLNNLLDITRLDGNYFSAHNILANIVPIIENVSDCIAPYATEKNIETTFDTLQEEIICSIDPELIERIILNLLSNAIKYGKSNGHIWIDIYPKDHRVWIHVKDDGLGIPAEKLPFIFDRFSRVDTGLIRPAEGAGLGLAIVKSLIELQNGTIEVSSNVNIGSEFIISFPIAPIVTDEAAYTFIPTLSKDKVIMELSDISLK